MFLPHTFSGFLVFVTVQMRYRQAKLSVTDRTTQVCSRYRELVDCMYVSIAFSLSQVSAVVHTLEENLELLCLTGVEDRLQVCSRPDIDSWQEPCMESELTGVFHVLQPDVRPTLELLRNAGIKVRIEWPRPEQIHAHTCCNAFHVPKGPCLGIRG